MLGGSAPWREYAAGGARLALMKWTSGKRLLFRQANC
jgi:hypothetical protein